MVMNTMDDIMPETTEKRARETTGIDIIGAKIIIIRPSIIEDDPVACLHLKGSIPPMIVI